MLHFNWSGGSGFAVPWLDDLKDWLFGMLMRRVFSLEWEPVSNFSFSLVSSKLIVRDSLAKFLINSSRRRSSGIKLAAHPLSNSWSLWTCLGLANGDFRNARACNCGLLFNPKINPLEASVEFPSSWLASKTIRSCPELGVLSDCWRLAPDATEEEFFVASSLWRSRCCLSRTTCDCRRAYRWLGRLSNCTLRLARLVWVVWYSVRPL